MATLPEAAEWAEGIYQLEKTDPVSGGSIIDPSTKQGISNYQALQLASRTKYLRERLDDLSRVDQIEVTVGSSGDFQTINDALEELSRIRFGYKAAQILATITLKAGFVMEEQILMRGGNLSYINIVGEDAFTVIDRAALTSNALREPLERYPAFGGVDGAVLPIVEQQFEMNDDGPAHNRFGIDLLASTAVFDGAGVRNAGSTAAAINNASRFRASSSDFSGAGQEGLNVTSAAIADVALADFSGAANRGIVSRRGAVVNGFSANARKSGSDSPDDIVVEQGGFIAANNATGGTNVTPNEISSAGTIMK